MLNGVLDPVQHLKLQNSYGYFPRAAFAGVLGLLLILITLTGCDGRASASIRPDYSAESETVYEVQSDSLLAQAVMIQGETNSISSYRARIAVRVGEQADDGGAIVTLTLNSYDEASGGGPGAILDFRSDRPDEENKPAWYAPKLREIISSTVRLEMSSTGAARYLDGLSEMEMDDQGEREHGGIFQPIWWESFAEHVFRTDADQESVRVGSSWTSGRLTTRMLRLSLSSLIEHEVVAVTDNRIEIEGRGGFSVDFSDEFYSKENPATLEDQSIETLTVWDSTLGRLFEYRSEQVLQIHQSMDGIEVARRYSNAIRIRRLFGTTQSDPAEGRSVEE